MTDTLSLKQEFHSALDAACTAIAFGSGRHVLPTETSMVHGNHGIALELGCKENVK